MTTIAFHFAARSDVGMVRANNEDSAYAGPHLLAMADGMGGHAGGDVASSTIIAHLVDLDGQSFSGVEATERLLAAIAEGNAELGAKAEEDRDLEGMGTTLIALFRARDKLVLAHIGDSRAFLVRDGKVTQITKDHSFVQSLVDEGRITSDEASTHPQRSLVTRVLTGHPEDEPDIVVRRAKVGDRYLIASDGLTDYVARDTVDEVLLTTSRPGDAADRLVELSLRAGAPDNVTIVIGDVVDLRLGPVPPDQPVVVGAAAIARKGTRALPVTPAEKAAALAKEATGRPDEDDGVTLAEEGPASRAGRIAKLLGTALAIVVILGGLSYAGWWWTQRQYFVGLEGGTVTVFRGIDQSIGTVSLSTPIDRTDIRVDDLPENYRASLVTGLEFSSRAAADKRVAELRVQAAACIWAKEHGEACTSVSDTWTPPTPSPSASPSGSASSSGPASPSPSPTSKPGPTPRVTVPASPGPGPRAAAGPVASSWPEVHG